ncbi:MAG: hypothetical protein AB1762_12920 [Gemmatimonadota bacterium]
MARQPNASLASPSLTRAVWALAIALLGVGLLVHFLGDADAEPSPDELPEVARVRAQPDEAKAELPAEPPVEEASA